MTYRYNAVIFDMDGLLFDTENIGRWAWQYAMIEHGYILTDELYSTFTGRDLSYREQVLRETFGAGFPFESVKELRISAGDRREITEGLPLKAGVKETLGYLRKKGLKTGLATGTARERALRRLRDAGIEDYFPVIVTSDNVPEGKPAPGIYIEASRRLGVSPGECIVLEDSAPGVIAANKAGMLTIMTPDMEEPTEELRQLCYRVLVTLDEAPQVIDGLL